MPSPLLPDFMKALKSAKAAAGLNEAIALAALAHAGQTDKGGASYIAHPLRVMLGQTNELAMTAAVLHDVLEDVPEIISEDLREMGFPEKVLTALALLTKGPGEDYSAFIHRIGQSKDQIALAVKVADLVDNSDLRRIPNPTEKDIKRIAKYKAAALLLGTPPYWTPEGVADLVNDETERQSSTAESLIPPAGVDRLALKLALREAQKGYEGAREDLANRLKRVGEPFIFLPRELDILSDILVQKKAPHRPGIAPSSKSLDAIKAVHLAEILRAASGLVVLNGRTVAHRTRGAECTVMEACCSLLGCSEQKYKQSIERSKRKRRKRRDILPEKIREHFEKNTGYELPPTANKFFNYCLDNNLL